MRHIDLRRIFSHKFLIAIGLALSIAASPAKAQTNSTDQATLPARDALVSKGLEPLPLDIESLGLKLHLPLGTEVVTEKVDGNLILNMADSQETPTWSMRVQQMNSSLQRATAKLHVDDLLSDLTNRKHWYEVVANEPRMINGREGQICYLKRKTPQGELFISGTLILPTGERSFMVFSTQTLEEHLPRIRPIFEASFATIELRNAQDLASERNERFEAGQAMLASFTEEKLRSMIGKSQWHRIHRPIDKASGAAQELGYTRVDVTESMKGTTTGRPESSYTQAEKELGLLVRVQARLVVDAEKKDFYDSIASYWMAWDQSEEVWSIRATRRQGEAEKSESETGIREAQSSGSPRPRLTVIKRTDTTDPVPYDWEVPPGYMPQALGWLVGPLLPQKPEHAREYATYFFVSSSMTPKIFERIDRWEPTGDGSGGWTLNSQFTSNSPPFTSIYGSDGRLIRRVHSDGTVTEPIELNALQSIWKTRGLQIGR